MGITEPAIRPIRPQADDNRLYRVLSPSVVQRRRLFQDERALKSDWLTYANEQVASGKPVRNIGKAFVGWCKNKESLR